MPSFLLRLSDNHPHSEKEDDQTKEKNTWLLSELKMLFYSRARFAHIEDIPLVNASILNYGIDECVSCVNEVDQRKSIIETRIINALLRFEPRLNHIVVTTRTDNPTYIMFEINAIHQGMPVRVELVWDDCTGKFYFNE